MLIIQNHQFHTVEEAEKKRKRIEEDKYSINNKIITLLFMKDTKFKNLFNQDNKIILIGLLSLLIIFWIILYIIPSFFISLFNTILGNLILLTSLILITSQDLKYGISVAIILIILYRISHIKANFKERFTWSKESNNKFIELQNSINPGIVFDTKEIQNQASQEEVDYFLKNSMWHWSKDTEKLYKELLEKNTYVRTDPDDAINKAKTKYNQTIIMEILSLQSDALKRNKIVNINTDNRNGLGSYPYEAGLISQQ